MPKQRSLGSHQSAHSKSEEWLTPPEIMAKLGEFDLDPCSPAVRPWDTAKLHYSKHQDGLSQPWEGRVFVNPPFGKEAIKWLTKLAEHGNGIALIPARTETKMFYDTIWGKANGVLFVKSRPHFHYVDGGRAPFNSGAPICLVAYGLQNLVCLFQSGLGFTVISNERKVEKLGASQP